MLTRQPSSLEYIIEGRDFKFCSHPYFLRYDSVSAALLTFRLTFPHEIVDDGRQKASYDIEKGELTVNVPKAVIGQEFENLDMITTLMTPKPVSICRFSCEGD